MLQERGYIRVHVRRTEETSEVERRFIYCGMFPDRETAPPSGEDLPDPPAEDCLPSGEKSPDPPAKSRTCIIGRKDLPEHIPLPPPGEGRGGRKRDKSVPSWKPERFEAFWEYYRTHARGEDRQGAVQEWDKLQPDDALIAVMGRALQAQVASKSWREGIGIPYAKRWLSNQRWKDSLPRDRRPRRRKEGSTDGTEGFPALPGGGTGCCRLPAGCWFQRRRRDDSRAAVRRP